MTSRRGLMALLAATGALAGAPGLPLSSSPARMFDALVMHMHRAVSIDRGLADARRTEVPSWL